jgi:pyridinium-3,5-biscarboxylic acid mononucleotide sulfurtransferase
MTETSGKLDRLREILAEMGGVVVGYSGGVDSSLLLSVAAEVLGARCVAATARSEVYPTAEYEASLKLVQDLGIEHVVFETSELDIEGFSENPPDRCYFCKQELFGKLQRIADERDIRWIAHAAQTDDLGDRRPGLRAAKEMNARAPLIEARLTKEEVRELSRERNLPTWDKPAMACLASRFPYGSKITAQKLEQVGEAECLLRELGFRQYRARHHGSVVRIEVSAEEMPRLIAEPLCSQVVERLKVLGFTYVTLDLQGFRSGSMNETLV